MHPPPPLLPFLSARLPDFIFLVPICIAVAKRKSLDKPLQIIFSFVVFSFLLTMLNMYFSYHSIHNLVVFHFYAPFEFAFILFFYSYLIDGVLKKAIIPLITVFAVWSVVNFFFVQTGLQLNTYTRPVEAMFIMLYCLAFFNKQTASEAAMRWGSLSYNWVTLAFTIFYGCNFFLFIFSNYFLKYGDKLSGYFWQVYNAIFVVETLLLTIAFLQVKRLTGQKAGKAIA